MNNKNIEGIWQRSYTSVSKNMYVVSGIEIQNSEFCLKTLCQQVAEKHILFLESFRSHD